MRYFETGATRNNDEEKLDFEGFLSPYVLYRFAEYMHEHRFQADGKTRDSDNWQKGIPQSAYMKSMMRHVMELWLRWREQCDDEQAIQDTLCAILFNAQGFLHELLATRHDPVGPQVPVENSRHLRAHLGGGCSLAYDNFGPDGVLLDHNARRALWAKANNPVDRYGRVFEQERS